MGQSERPHEVHGQGLIFKVVNVASNAVFRQNVAVEIVTSGRRRFAGLAAELPPALAAEVRAVDEVEAGKTNGVALTTWETDHN